VDPAVQRMGRQSRVSGYSVPDVPKQKSAFEDTLFSNNQKEGLLFL